MVEVVEEEEGVCVYFNLGRRMQPSRVFMKDCPSRAVKHRGSMVRIPATPLMQQFSGSSITLRFAYANVLRHTQTPQTHTHT